MKKYLFLSIALITLISSCKKEEINYPPVAVISYIVKSGTIELHGEKSTDPENNLVDYHWITDANDVLIKDSNKSIAYFEVPQLTVDKTIKITLIVGDGQFQDSSAISIAFLANNNIRIWGLGSILKSTQSNNRAYEWYLDQMNTGTFSDINCGPTSATMAIKWFNQNFTGTPQDARNAYRPQGGWWYTSDIINYLKDNGVNNSTIRLDSINILKGEINMGNIVILCLDTYYISYCAESEFRRDKFYSTSSIGSGHFIVIKGYKQVDNLTYYEAYDPGSYGRKYLDNSLKGKDRYYKSNDLDVATNNWWNYAIVVSKGTLKSKSIDNSTIIHMPGK
jgi:hypothetical protein